MTHATHRHCHPRADDTLDSAHDFGQVIHLLFNRLAKTEELRGGICSATSEILHLWAGQSGLKKKIAGGVTKSLKKGLVDSQADAEKSQVATLLDEPGFVKLIGKLLPRLVDNLTEGAASLATGIEKLPFHEKETLFSRPIADADMGRGGQLVTRVFRILNEIHSKNPTFFADKVKVAFRACIENVDFGELKEAVDSASEDVAATVEACNDELWSYPAKIVSLFALLPALLRMQVNAAVTTLERLNQVAPDLLTDIVLSLLRAVDVKSIGTLVNEIAELGRKLHTGSALLGKAGEPQLASDARDHVDALLSTLDAKLLLDTRARLTDAKHSLYRALMDRLRQQPEITKHVVSSNAKALHARTRLNLRKLTLLDDLSDTDLAEAMTDGLRELEAQEVAEIANLTCSLLNRLASLEPKLVGSVATQLATTLDPCELQESVKVLSAGSFEPLKPMARAVLPTVVKCVCASLQPDDDEFEDEAAEARAALRTLFLGREAAA